MSERKCIVTRQVCGQDALLRFVRSPDDGQVVPDLKNQLPGRGVWVGNNQDLVAEAQKRKLFARAFKESCTVPDNLAIRVGELLDGSALGYLSLAKKAGQAVQGYEKVDSMISAGQIAVLLGASDGSVDGRGKLKQRAGVVFPGLPVVESFQSAQLGLALGRTNVIHAAISIGRLADKFVAATYRAEKYRSSVDQDALEFEEKA